MVLSTLAPAGRALERRPLSGSRFAYLTTASKLMDNTPKTWRALNGSTLVTDVFIGVEFSDGIKKTAA